MRDLMFVCVAAVIALLGLVALASADHPTTVERDTLVVWQARCGDGRKTPVHEAPYYIHEQLPVPDGGGNIAGRGNPRAAEGPYGTRFSDEFCGASDVVEARGRSVREYEGRGWYRGPTTPPHPDIPHGPDEVQCNCLGTITFACFDALGPDHGGRAPTHSACAKACAVDAGALVSWARLPLIPDSARCLVEARGDRGPEVHCVCRGVPEALPLCGDDPGLCTDRGCEVHHTAPRSTRCVPAGTTTSTTMPDITCECPDNCSITAALSALQCVTRTR